MKRLVISGFGILFIVGLCLNWHFLYDKIISIQFLTLIILLSVLIAFLIIDFIRIRFFSSSVLELLIGNLSKIEQSTKEMYLSLFVTIFIGIVGVIAVILSILYGTHINASTSAEERLKLLYQNFIWFLFSIYLTCVMVGLFIRPLMKKLQPEEQSIV